MLAAPPVARGKGLHFGLKIAVAATVAGGAGCRDQDRDERGHARHGRSKGEGQRGRRIAHHKSHGQFVASYPRTRHAYPVVQFQDQSGDLSWPPGDYQKKVNEVIGLLSQGADLLAAIRDRPTAESNLPQVETLGNRITAIAAEIDRMEHSGNFTLDEANFSQQCLPQINAVVSRIQSEFQRLQLLGEQLQMEERFNRVGRGGFGSRSAGHVFEHQPGFGGQPNIPKPPQMAPIQPQPLQPQPIQPISPPTPAATALTASLSTNKPVARRACR